MAWDERYVDAAAAGGGNGTTTATSGANGAWTLAEAGTSAVSGQRVNVKAGTYSSAITMPAGTWFRGYSSSIGDLDSDYDSDNYPVITGATGMGTAVVASNLNISVSNTSQAVTLGVDSWIHMCRLANSGTGRVVVCSTTSRRHVMSRCRIQRAIGTTDCIFSRAVLIMYGCEIIGGTNGVLQDANNTSGGLSLFNCLVHDQSNYGIRLTATGSFREVYIIGSTFHGQGTACVNFSSGLPFIMFGNVLSDSVTGIDAALTPIIGARCENLFHSNSTANEAGFGDIPSLSEFTDASSPFVDSASDDFLLASGSSGYGADRSFVGPTPVRTYADIGPLQHQDAGGGGGLLVGGGMTGGFHRT